MGPTNATYAYTHLRADGNRVVAGSGHVRRAEPVPIDVDGPPAWLLAFDDGSASRWTVVTEAGTATTHRVDDGTADRLADHGTVATPPLAYLTDGAVDFVAASGDGAVHSPPVPVAGGSLYVADGGDLVLRRGGTHTRFDVAAPGDARVVALGGDRYALFGGRTDRYRHGALGDTTEGSALVVVDAAGRRVETMIRLDPPTVFEGLSPLVADLDGDGTAELVTTIADSRDGARVRVYGTDGTSVATGPIYGPGWRHQLCVAPFPPDGAPELAVVRKPHVDRTLEFYRLEGNRLRVTATHDGFASHTYGSRNVDGGLAGDLDGDGRTELLVPTSDRTTLAAVARTDGGAETAWSLPLGGRLSTNVAGVELADGRVSVGAGTDEGVRVWQG